MEVQFHRTFKKQYQKLPQKVQKKFNDRLELLLQDPLHPLLNLHQLRGKTTPLQSINVTADYRAIFTFESDDVLLFHEIGTHSQLYS